MAPSLFVLWLGLLDVQGDSTCPRPAEVSQHLSSLGNRSGVGTAEHANRVNLSSGEGFVNIELLGADGELLAERRLERAAPCDELAEAVAVIVAAWEAEFSPALAAPKIETPPPASPPVVAAVPAKVEVRRPLAFDAGIGPLTSVVGGEAVFGAKLAGAAFPLVIPLGIEAAFSVATNHTQSTSASPSIDAHWMRPALSLGPDLRLRGGALALDIHGDAVFALLAVQGTGLSRPASDTGLQLGLSVGLRGLWTWNKGALWFAVDLFDYPGQDRLTLGNQGGSQGTVGQLPHLEVQIAVGASFGRFR